MDFQNFIRGYPYRYCGKERDEESGMYYYGARYYLPWTCRFVSVDPMAGKFTYYTPYQYAGNRPINFIDLDGKEEAHPNNSNVSPPTSIGGFTPEQGQKLANTPINNPIQQVQTTGVQKEPIAGRQMAPDNKQKNAPSKAGPASATTKSKSPTKSKDNSAGGNAKGSSGAPNSPAQSNDPAGLARMLAKRHSCLGCSRL